MKHLLNNMVTRVIVDVVTEGGMQFLKVLGLADEVREGVESFLPFGFAHYPKPGAEGIMLSVGGQRDVTMVIAVADRRYKLELSEGDVAIHNAAGDYVKITDGGDVEVSASGKINLGGGDDPLVRKSDLKAVVDAYNSHTHGGASSSAGPVTIPPPTTSAPVDAATANGSPQIFGAS